MAKFSRGATLSPPTAQVPVTPAPIVRSITIRANARTAEHGAGFTRDPQSELFMLAVTNFVGEKTFYESAADRDSRFAKLVNQLAHESPAWLRAFIPYLRDKLNMRTAAVVAVAEYIRAGGPNGRALVAATLTRSDEPAELLGYWFQTYGRKVPKPLKRGLADAVEKLYTEFAALKYDSSRATIRMADVIELVHPEAGAVAWRSALYRWLLDVRHGRAPDLSQDGYGSLLKMVRARAALEGLSIAERRSLLLSPDGPAKLQAAGMTWEALSGWLQGPMDKVAWEAIIPSMGYMALLRNLRNFDDADIGDRTRALVISRLTNPVEVAKSRQLPLRFYSAYDAVKTGHWTDALKIALDLTLQNIPALPGRTLVLIDISRSMEDRFSTKTDRRRWELAGLFGGAIGARAEHADVYAYTDTIPPSKIVVRQGMSPLIVVDALRPLNKAGTKTWDAAKATFKDHDRVIIVTDEQSFPWSAEYERRYIGIGNAWGEEQSSIPPSQALPANVPVFTFNIAGYKVGHMPSGIVSNRHTFGGLSDAAFAAIPMLERVRGEGTDWTFLTEDVA